MGKRGPNKGQGGRPKGAVNKITATLKEAILLAANKAGGGGHEGLTNYLEEQARNNPVGFMSLLGRALPHTIAGDPDAPLKTETVHLDHDRFRQLASHVETLQRVASADALGETDLAPASSPATGHAIN